MANNILIQNLIEEMEILSPLQFNLIKKLKEEGPLTRRQLVNKLRTPRTTIYDNLVKLQKKKVVEKFSRNNGKRGRPKVYWKILK
ncbi:MAG: helix-turn-helix domain-containing protein [Promethearchaeati archaeon]